MATNGTCQHSIVRMQYFEQIPMMAILLSKSLPLALSPLSSLPLSLSPSLHVSLFLSLPHLSCESMAMQIRRYTV